jgi:hypothetical protein
MSNKYHSDTQEKIESILYSPDKKNTGDLEAGTHTIVPTSRPAIGSAQYSSSLTLAKPDDSRMEVLRIAARLSVNIAGLGTATHVHCSVRVDVDDSDHELFSEDWVSTGAKLASANTHSGGKASIFNLLKDGAAHTFYFLFWADAASQATIDVVQLWAGVGQSQASGEYFKDILKIAHKGWGQVGLQSAKVGTGTTYTSVFNGHSQSWNCALIQESTSTVQQMSSTLAILDEGFLIAQRATAAADLQYISTIKCVLRSEL